MFLPHFMAHSHLRVLPPTRLTWRVVSPLPRRLPRCRRGGAAAALAQELQRSQRHLRVHPRVHPRVPRGGWWMIGGFWNLQTNHEQLQAAAGRNLNMEKLGAALGGLSPLFAGNSPLGLEHRYRSVLGSDVHVKPVWHRRAPVYRSRHSPEYTPFGS